MSGLLLTMASTILCVHAGKANLVMPNLRVRVMGVPVPMMDVPAVVTGCTLPPPPAANGPCVTGTWLTGTMRVRSMGQPLLTQTSTSLVMPTNTMLVITSPGQARVIGM